MFLKKSSKWKNNEKNITPENIYFNRRTILKSMGFSIIPVSYNSLLFANQNYKYNYKNNSKYFIDLDRSLTEESKATNYNNFYEFGSTKNIKRAAQKLSISPWAIKIDGLVNKELTIDIDDLIKKINLEERIYRLRCVEAWSMLVPWIGFPLKEVFKIAEPKSNAKYLVMKTFYDPVIALNQRQSWYPWPYTEALTVEEALNDLSFIATGVYGRELPKQNGAPLRLLLPWKYGFKSIKSIVSFTFVEKKPLVFWEEILPKEYGFWANVNPKVHHPRWRQIVEKDIGTGKYRNTEIYNGYAEWVAYLYKDMPQNDQLFR